MHRHEARKELHGNIHVRTLHVISRLRCMVHSELVQICSQGARLRPSAECAEHMEGRTVYTTSIRAKRMSLNIELCRYNGYVADATV